MVQKDIINCNNKRKVVVVGGGAAGFFAAIACKEKNPLLSVIILEKTATLLSKVRISGGGRCNVTHACFDVRKLVQNYPRGARELTQAFHYFQPKDTVDWFQGQGVFLKTEADGRMFPVTDSSQTIIDCFLKRAQDLGIEIIKEAEVVQVSKQQDSFLVQVQKMDDIEADAIVFASGSNKKIYSLIERLGHTIAPPVPSLFTFSLPGSPLLELAGVAVPDVSITCEGVTQRGPLLITHWGLSGPCVLKLSAWCARKLYEKNYRTEIVVQWVPDRRKEAVLAALENYRKEKGAKSVGTENPFSLPKSLWKYFVKDFSEKRYAALTKQELIFLAETLTGHRIAIDGKTTYKEEFVTCGGVSLNEVDFRTMESKLLSGIYFSGEVLDIDGVTGGFNFQNAWTTASIAGAAVAEKYLK